MDVFFWFQEKPEGERELEADPDLIETAGVFAEDSLVNVRKEVEGGWWRVDDDQIKTEESVRVLLIYKLLFMISIPRMWKKARWFQR